MKKKTDQVLSVTHSLDAVQHEGTPDEHNSLQSKVEVKGK